MKISEAFALADQIQYHYERNLQHSNAINTTILNALGEKKYKKFCEIVEPLTVNEPYKKHFKKEFTDNPVNTENELTDKDVHTNYSFSKLMKALGMIVE